MVFGGCWWVGGCWEVLIKEVDVGEMMVLTMCAVEQGVVLGVSEHRPNDGTPRVIPNRGPESSGLAR